MRGLLVAALGLVSGCDRLLNLEYVPALPAIDAGADVFVFDPSLCPVSYDITVTGSTSKYRAITIDATWSTQWASCASDLPMGTHLAAPELADELLRLRAAVPVTISERYYIGAVQSSMAIALDAGWHLVTGTDLPTGLWDTGQPNDNTGVEDGDQNYAVFQRSAAPPLILYDYGPNEQFGAVCECDGLPTPITGP